jgi:hypothetical protein
MAVVQASGWPKGKRMDEHEIEAKIHDLEACVSDLEQRLDDLTRFSAILVGRLAAAIGDPPDLGLPDDVQSTGEFDRKLAMLLAYNAAAGKS